MTTYQDEREFSPEELNLLYRRTTALGGRLRRRRSVTRAVLSAVVLVMVLVPVGLVVAQVRSSTGSTATPLEAASMGSFRGVDWNDVTYPGIGCNDANPEGFKVDVEQVDYVRAAGSDSTMALVLVKCDVGSPAPSSLFAFAPGGDDSAPRLFQTLLTPPGVAATTVWYATHFRIRSGQISMAVQGVTGRTGLCCPDVFLTMRWSLIKHRFVQEAHVARAVAKASAYSYAHPQH